MVATFVDRLDTQRSILGGCKDRMSDANVHNQIS